MPITIFDETATGKVLQEITLDTEASSISIKDLIKERVFQEVISYNEKQSDLFKGLVQPTETERTLNGYRMKNKRTIDPEKQYYIALDAFQNNGFFILVNDRQEDDLEAVLELKEPLKVSFVKLTPLVGG